MTLTIEQAALHIEHQIGGPLVGIDNRRVIDEAGRRLFKKRKWNWTVGASTTLTLTSGQSYINLPSDFSATKVLTFTNGFQGGINECDFKTLAGLRSFNLFPFFWLYVLPTHVADSNGIPQPRYEVFPTPATTQSGVLTLWYHKKWTDLAATDATYIPVPDWFEELFIQAVRAVAQGYQTNDMDAQLERLFAGADFTNTLMQDEGVQWNFGPLIGGQLSQASPNADDWILSQLPIAPTHS